MKFNFVKALVAVALSALLAYALYSLDKSDNGLLLPIGGGILYLMTLVTALGINVTGVRSMANAKIVAWIFFFIFLVLNFIFSRSGFNVPTFIIVNGFILLVFILITYSLLKASKEQK